MEEIKSNVDNLAKDIFLLGRKKSLCITHNVIRYSTMIYIITKHYLVLEILHGLSATLTWPVLALNYSA